MKPRLGVLLLLSLLLTLTGLLMACQPQNGSPGDYLLYQTYPYRMEGRLTVDGDSHRIRLTAEEEGKRATVTFSDTASGQFSVAPVSIGSTIGSSGCVGWGSDTWPDSEPLSGA